ncbi:LlaJI family restriction endonuclease [Salinicoccus sp. Marseille-QA3877]
MFETEYGFDKGFVSVDTITYFELKQPDIRFDSKEKEYYYNFVGIISQKDKNLIVFPCRYLNNIDDIKEKDSRMLFQTIFKYLEIAQTNPKAELYYGDEHLFDSNFPFQEFLNVYEYYIRYNFYRYEKKRIKDGYSGNIAWKSTIQQSNTILNNGNLIYVPFKVKVKEYNYEFISECMSFVINYTISRFESFIFLKKVEDLHNNFDFITNRDFVIRKLMNIFTSLRKDHEKNLVQNLISFFRSFDEVNKANDFHIKIKYFNFIWQNMVTYYLNNHFIDMQAKKLVISKTVLSKKNEFESFDYYIDDSKNNFYISPDHIWQKNDTLYLFDSKYYRKITHLDYKQFTYLQIFRNISAKSFIKIISAIILPGPEENVVEHFKLKSDDKFVIYELTLPVKDVMKSYLESPL